MKKFSLAVTEFNPLHNGHKRLLDLMRADGSFVALIMSGNFCQRGEAAILDKYTRARHAILAGADVVFELPAVFSTAPAEMFAKGAIKLLSSIEGEKTLYFGTERGERKDFEALAAALSKETKEFKSALKAKLDEGKPFALARAEALKETSGDVDLSLLESPNSILGVEYVKAIGVFGADMAIEPVIRDGDYLSKDLSGGTCSALAVRAAIEDGKKKKIKKFVPDYVYGDLPDALPKIDDVAIYSILRADKRDLKRVTDCTEGLENRLKSYATGATDMKSLVDKLETKRYTRARISRIIINQTLGITRELTEKALRSGLYLKVLAVAADKKDVLSEIGGRNRLITRKADADKLSGVAEAVFDRDVTSCEVWSLIAKKRINPYEMKIIKRD